MQKFERRNTCTPTDASQVCSNCDSTLRNPEGRDRVLSSKTLSNNSDVNHSQHTGNPDLRVQDIVYVLNMRGQPLMPTKQQKANKLLKQKKARVVKRSPFTIQLLQASGENKQEITLGIDAGYRHVGFSAVSEKKELLGGALTLRTDIKRLLDKRRIYRRTRRGRLWHREARFLNREIKKGWFAPSIQHKLNSHVKLVEGIKKVLPITKIIVEVASFDTQKMMNPETRGIGYQQGTLKGYEVRAYLLEKFKHKCAYCGKTNTPLEVEHIIPKSRGGSNQVSNLVIACVPCNKKKNAQTATEFGHPKIQARAKKTLKATAFMNTVSKRIVEILNCDKTYGYITKHNRTKRELEKTHINDAFIIAEGERQKRTKPYICKQVRRNNRRLQTNRKGFKPSIRKQRYKIQPNDLVKFNDTLCRVKGMFNYGNWVRMVTNAGKIVNTTVKNVDVLKYGKGIQWN